MALRSDRAVLDPSLRGRSRSCNHRLLMPPRSTRARALPVVAEPALRSAKRPTVADGIGDDVGAAELGRRVADSVKRLRSERHLSLDQLAAQSGVSRASLSQIESARTNPTLGVIWKVAVGLGVPFQSLVGQAETSASKLLRAGDAIPLRSTDGRMESRLLSAHGPADRIEVYELRFQTKGLHLSEPHGAGTYETVILLT